MTIMTSPTEPGLFKNTHPCAAIRGGFPKGARYVLSSAVAPYVDEENKIVIFNGRARAADRKSPQVNSGAIWLSGSVIRVDYEYWDVLSGHVHGRGYFVCEKGRWVKRHKNYKPVQEALGREAYNNG